MATAADAAAAGGRRNATPPEWREFSREMIDVLREIQGQTASNHDSTLTSATLFMENCLKLLGRVPHSISVTVCSGGADKTP